MELSTIKVPEKEMRKIMNGDQQFKVIGDNFLESKKKKTHDTSVLVDYQT